MRSRLPSCLLKLLQMTPALQRQSMNGSHVCRAVVAEHHETNALPRRPYGISQQVATSAEVMQENSFDPSHSNYVHGSTFQKREDAMPMRAKLITKVLHWVD